MKDPNYFVDCPRDAELKAVCPPVQLDLPKTKDLTLCQRMGCMERATQMPRLKIWGPNRIGTPVHFPYSLGVCREHMKDCTPRNLLNPTIWKKIEAYVKAQGLERPDPNLAEVEFDPIEPYTLMGVPANPQAIL